MELRPVNLMHLAPRCTAHSKRTGEPCRSPAVRGFSVCRMHGARGGAPTGSRNGRWRHGEFSSEAIEARREIAGLLRHLKSALPRLVPDPHR